MSQVSTSQELQAQSEELLQGPLKHARTAALALALVPLAAVAVTHAGQTKGCPQSAGICGTVFYDTNGNGVQDAGEPGIPGVSVTIDLHVAEAATPEELHSRHQRFRRCMTSERVTPRGTTYTVSVQIPPDTTAVARQDQRRRPMTSTTATACRTVTATAWRR